MLLGELACWAGILLQSRFILFLENAIWTAHAAMMLYYSQTGVQAVVYGAFCLYMILIQLPAQHSALKSYADCSRYQGTAIAIPDQYNKSWTVPVLLSMPLLTAVIYFDMNAGRF